MLIGQHFRRTDAPTWATARFAVVGWLRTVDGLMQRCDQAEAEFVAGVEEGEPDKSPWATIVRPDVAETLGTSISPEAARSMAAQVFGWK